MKNKAKTRMPLEFKMTQVGLGDGMRSDHFSWRQTFFLSTIFFHPGTLASPLTSLKGALSSLRMGGFTLRKVGLKISRRRMRSSQSRLILSQLGEQLKKNRHYALSWQEAVIVVLV